jgi:type IV pilus assembly protein PilQ
MRMTTWSNVFVSLAVMVPLAMAADPQPQQQSPQPPSQQLQPPQPQRQAGIVPMQGMGRRAPNAELQKRLKTLVSVNFRDAPIEEVIESLAEQAGIDIVKSPTVTGKVTATLTDVPLDEAMESILGVHGYAYMSTESIVWIVPRNQLPVNMPTKKYHIDYADMEELNKAINGMVSSQGKVAMNAKTRDVFVTDLEDQIKLLDEFIKEMDRETPQVLVEARIYDVSCAEFLDLGFKWSAGTLTIVDAETGKVIGGRTDPFVGGALTSSISQADKGDFALRFGVLSEHADVDATLTAAQDDIRAKLLANPRVLVLNDQQANIDIVSEIPYQELTQTAGGGNIGTTKFKEVGVKLMVTPHVTRNNKIKLDLQPEFSVQTGSVPMFIPGGVGSSAISSLQPIVDTRKAMTSALISDGETVVIGGLRKKDIVQEVSKIPLLGDIPLLGELFKFRGEKTVNSELIVFITPRIVLKPNLTEKEAGKLESMENAFSEPKPPKPLIDSGRKQQEDEEEKGE